MLLSRELEAIHLVFYSFCFLFFPFCMVLLCSPHRRTSLVGKHMHVVINPELVMEVEARMNRAYLPPRLLPSHLRTPTLPQHRKTSLFFTSAGKIIRHKFCSA